MTIGPKGRPQDWTEEEWRKLHSGGYDEDIRAHVRRKMRLMWLGIVVTLSVVIGVSLWLG